MDRAPAFTVDNFISNWNGEFPNYPLSAADLKKPHTVMGSLFQVFDRLGIRREAILAPPPEEERDPHIMYYWDLIPVINMTRVINHVVSIMPQVDALSINVIHFLQPSTTSSHSILLLPFNLMIFNEDRLRIIAPQVEELYGERDQVDALVDKKNKLLELLNERAEEKGKRAERLEKIDYDIDQFTEELKQEKEAHDIEKQELEAALEENRQVDLLVEQKTSQKDSILAEVNRKKALRVYNADDIKAQAEQASQKVQEAEEKLSSLGATLMQRENSIKNLQATKTNLDTANNLLHEIIKCSEGLKELETGDLESDSAEGELDVLETELSERRAALDELRAARTERAARLAHTRPRLHAQRALLLSTLHEAEERDKKRRECSRQAAGRAAGLQARAQQHEARRRHGRDHLAQIQDDFHTKLRSFEDMFLKKLAEAEKAIEDKLRNRHG